MGFFQLMGYSSSLREVRTGTQAGTWRQELALRGGGGERGGCRDEDEEGRRRRKMLDGSLSGSYSSSFLIQPRTTCLGNGATHSELYSPIPISNKETPP